MTILIPLFCFALGSGILLSVSGLVFGQTPHPVTSGTCKIEVTDRDNGWPVPLIELRTTNGLRFVTDNAGVIAIDAPELLDREAWFSVSGHGYEVAADGFGYRGIRLTPIAGKTINVAVTRTSIAKRIGRMTGAGLFAESQQLGEESEWHDGPVFGCDSVQNALHRGKMFWLWGDTNLAKYPLGIFHMTGATTELQPFTSFQPPLHPHLKYFLDQHDLPKPVAKMPGDGPTWVTEFVSLPDSTGVEHLVCTYRKIKAPLSLYEAGRCVWNDQSNEFEHFATDWQAEDGDPIPKTLAEGHPVYWTDENNQRWLLFGNPLPHVRIPATFEVWQDLTQWEVLSPQTSLTSAADGKPIEPHSGSIAWNSFRKRWVTVFMQKLGQPSPFGTLWYAESESPLGPWGPAVKILSHDNYTFYNPRLHPEFTPSDSPILLFEGTYTATFADHPEPTPRYDYNQILYRLDLDDALLTPAHQN